MSRCYGTGNLEGALGGRILAQGRSDIGGSAVTASWERR